MTENAGILKQLLNDPRSQVDTRWVMQILESHPCFYLPVALWLKRNSEIEDAEILQHLQSVVIMNCADRASIIDFVDPYKEGWDMFYPKEEIRKNPTEQTIDNFIQRFGQTSTPEEDAVLERLIFNPVPADYFVGADEQFDSTDPLALPPELRKKDIEKPEKKDEQCTSSQFVDPSLHPSGANVPDTQNLNSTPSGNNEPASEESLLTESLVKIFIKRHNYERALDIISRLSLNYPEKSVYFADQKRFLKKLIINQQYLNNKNKPL